MQESAGYNSALLRDEAWIWFNNHILTYDMLIESALVLVSLLVAMIAAVPMAPALQRIGARLGRYPRLSLRLRGLGSLPLPALWVVALFIADISSTEMGYDAGLCRLMMKLLLAWIGIRLVTRLIAHHWVGNLFSLVIFAIAALSIFGVLDQVTEGLAGAGFTLGEFRITVLGIIKGVLALAALLYGSMILAAFIDTRLAYTKLNVASRVLIGKITRIGLVALALLIAITTAGIDLSVLAVFGGAVGLGIGFGLQRNFSNMFSGLMLLMDQSIKPGDVIEITDPTGGQTTFGWVTHMGGRYTEIVTRDNKSYLIPNEQLITQQVVNWSHGDTRVRLKIGFGVEFESDPHRVKALVEEAVRGVPRVLDEPKPICHLVGFGDSSVDFSLRFWIADAEKGVTNVESDVYFAIWDAFKREGIRLPYPHRDVYIHEPRSEGDYR